MTAQRRAIRDATKAAIVAAGTSLGDRVFENRVIPFRHSQLPAASIYTTAESVGVLAESPRLYSRELRLVVQLVVQGDEDVDDRIDALSEEVERAMEFGGLIEAVPALGDLELSSVEGPELDSDGARIIGMLNLVYSATYERGYEVDDAELDDFTGATASIETHAPRDGAEAVTTFDV